ncbi:MAG: choice-of-anchor Q domain-containing protein [Methylococcales bacterium]
MDAGRYSPGAYLTITESIVSNNGVGISNAGKFTVTNSIVSNNNAVGINNFAQRYSSVSAVVNSSVSGNRGGGVVNFAFLEIRNSTISGNYADNGAGIRNQLNSYIPGHGAILRLENSTVSRNIARFDGGGILNTGYGYSRNIVTLVNSTVTGNTAGGNGGGVAHKGPTYYNYASTIEINLIHSLISGNVAAGGAEIYANAPIPVAANSYNLFGHDAGAGIIGFVPGPTDVVPTVGLNAILAPLGNNGGPSLTHALVAGSPAIDAAPAGATCPPADQRGLIRPQGAGCDIGAVEVTTSPDLAVGITDSPDPVVVGGHLTYTVTVANAGISAASQVTLTDTLSPSVRFVSASPGSECAEDSGTVSCDLGSLASGDSTAITIVVRPTRPGVLSNSVAVTSAELDGNPANNADSEDTTVHLLLCQGRVPTIIGTPGDDVIAGTDRRDIIMGLGGNDTIRGLKGSDVICGNGGNDDLFGEGGDDIINGGPGIDTLDGGPGNDTCDGGVDADVDAAAGCETVKRVP